MCARALEICRGVLLLLIQFLSIFNVIPSSQLDEEHHYHEAFLFFISDVVPSSQLDEEQLRAHKFSLELEAALSAKARAEDSNHTSQKLRSERDEAVEQVSMVIIPSQIMR